MANLNLKEYNVILECPLCGNKSLHVLKESNGTMQCLHCGYVTNDSLTGKKENNETYQALDDNMKKMTKEVKDKIWIPTVLTLDIGILSPILVDENMFWSFVPLVDIPVDEQENYPLPEGDGNYNSRYDNSQTVLYSDFTQALKEIKEITDGTRTLNTKQKIELPKLKKI